MEDLESRRYQILFEIIETYIETGEPVGSQFIARRLHQRLSPATIRNVMHELEEAGMLDHPHTSAGRIPTERGYRLYVDQLRRQEQFRPPHRMQPAVPVENLHADELVPMLQQACANLASWTQQAAFVLAPTIRQSRIKQIQLTLLSPNRVLCVLIATDGLIASHVIALDESLSEGALHAIVAFTNSELAGVPFEELLNELRRYVLVSDPTTHYLVKCSLELFEKALAIEPPNRLYVEGARYIMAQPEFQRDPQAMRDLLELFESEEALLQCLVEDLASGQMMVRIGGELSLGPLQECSCVLAPLKINQRVIGGLGIIGPKRMNYQRVNQAVETMSGHINAVLNRGNAWS
jgi:heat-inducible transcriptional repressor